MIIRHMIKNQECCDFLKKFMYRYCLESTPPTVGMQGSLCDYLGWSKEEIQEAFENQMVFPKKLIDTLGILNNGEFPKYLLGLFPVYKNFKTMKDLVEYVFEETVYTSIPGTCISHPQPRQDRSVVGWICPECRAVYAPHVNMCEACTPASTTEGPVATKW